MIVWARRGEADQCAAALAGLYADLDVLPLAVAVTGACG